MPVTTDDVSALLGRDLTNDETNRVGRLIDFAVSQVESAAPGLSYATGTEQVDIVWHDPDVAWTPRYPVTAVNSITLNGIPISLEPRLGYARHDAKGKIELLDVYQTFVVNAPIIMGWSQLTVDYDFGLDPTPDDLCQIVAGMVADSLRRASYNPAGAVQQSETLGSYQHAETFVAQSAHMVVPEIPQRWRRKAMTSVALTRTR